MKMKLLAAAILSSILAVPTFAQVGIYIGRTPPPLRYEVQPPMPGPDYAWTDGYWNWGGNSYAWVPGRWAQPPYAGAYWSHPHYDHYQQGWQMHEGHWDREDHGGHDNRGGRGDDRGSRGGDDHGGRGR